MCYVASNNIKVYVYVLILIFQNEEVDTVGVNPYELHPGF